MTKNNITLNIICKNKGKNFILLFSKEVDPSEIGGHLKQFISAGYVPVDKIQHKKSLDIIVKRS